MSLQNSLIVLRQKLAIWMRRQQRIRRRKLNLVRLEDRRLPDATFAFVSGMLATDGALTLDAFDGASDAVDISFDSSVGEFQFELSGGVWQPAFPGIPDPAVTVSGNILTVAVPSLSELHINGMASTLTSVTDSGAGFSVSRLDISDGGDVVLDSAGNDIDELTIAAHSLSFVDGDPDGLTIHGLELTDSLNLVTTGAVVDSLAPGQQIFVAQNASIVAASIELGDELTDDVTFGSLTFESTGHVAIRVDNDLALSGSSSAASLQLLVEGDLSDHATAETNISGHASFVAHSIVLGDDSELSFASVTFQATGDVDLHTNGEIFLTGSSHSNSLHLTSDLQIHNDANAELNVMGVAEFDADDITLGFETDDLLSLGSLRFIASNNVSIAEDSDMDLSDGSSAQSVVLLAAGNIEATAAGANLAVSAQLINLSATGAIGSALQPIYFDGELLATESLGGDQFLAEFDSVDVLILDAASNAITLTSGRFEVQTQIIASDVHVGQAILGGTGVVFAEVDTVAGSVISPGQSPGILTTGNFNLATGASLDIEIDGAGVGTQYDQLQVNGTVTLAGTLNVLLSATYLPVDGTSFTIIDNDSSDPVTGEFAGLAEGDLVTVGGQDFIITYRGGDGNDVVLFAGVPEYNFATANVNASEGDSGTTTTNVSLTRTGNTAIASSVDVLISALVGDTAAAGFDFVSETITVQFLAGETLAMVDVQILGDEIVEKSETLSLTLSNFTAHGQAGTIQSSSTVTILNDDLASIVVGDISQLENGVFSFELTLDKVSSYDITVQADTANIPGGATAGTDYTAIAGQVVTFSANGVANQTRTVVVTVNDDAIVEADQQFVLQLSNAAFDGLSDLTRVVIADNEAVATIENNDSAVLTIDDVSLDEGDGVTTDFVFTVELSAAVEGGLQVSYFTIDDSAISAAGIFQDFIAASGTLTFAGTAGEQKTISVIVNADSWFEPTEVFKVQLGSPLSLDAAIDSATFLSTAGSPAVGTIENDDTEVFARVVAGDLIISDEVQGGKDNLLTIKKDGVDIVISSTVADLGTGSSVASSEVRFALAVVTGQITVSGHDGDDVLTVDFSGGSPIAPLGLSYNGGNQTSGDGLSVIGDGTNNASYTPDSLTPGNGQILVDGDRVTFNDLEPVDISSMATVTVQFPNANDLVLIQNGTDYFSGGVNPALRVSGTSGGVAFETVALWDNGEVIVDTTSVDGSDRVAIASADNAHANSSLQVVTGIGSDTIDVTGDIALAQSLRLQANAIGLNTAMITSGTSQVYDGSTKLAASITLSGTLVTFNGTLDSDLAGSNSLTISGSAVFNGTVGTTPLASLHVTDSSFINASGISTGGAQQFGGNVLIGVDAVLTATTVDFESTVDSEAGEQNALTVFASTIFHDAVGVTDRIKLLAVTGVSAEFHSTVATANGGLAVTTTNAATFLGAVSTVSGGSVSISNDGLLTLAAAADFNLDGSFTQSGAGTVVSSAEIVTTGDKIIMAGALTQSGAILLDTTNGGAIAGANITLAAVNGAGNNLTVNAGSAGIVTVASIGNTSVTKIVNSGQTTVAGTVSGSTFQIDDTTASVILNGTVNVTSFVTANYAYAVEFNEGGSVTNAVTMANSGGVTFGNDNTDTIKFIGGLTSVVSLNTIQGQIETVGTDIVLGTSGLTGSVTLKSSGGNITGGLTTGATVPLTLNAAAGSITLNNAANVLGNLTVTGNTVTISENNAITQSNAWLTTGVTTLNAAGHDILLTSSSNVLGVLNLTAANATVAEAADLEMGTSLISNQLTLNTAGAVLDSLVGESANITATTLVITSAQGIGSTDNLNTAIDTLSATNTNSGTIRIAEADGIAIETITNAARDISLTAGGAVTDANAAMNNIVAGKFTVAADGGIDLDTNVTTLSAVNTTIGVIRIHEANSLALDTINNGNREVELTTGGAITDAGDANVDLVAGVAVVTITGSGSFGTSANRIETEINDLSIDTSANSGDQYVAESTSIAALNLNAGSGTIGLTAGGAIEDNDATLDLQATSARLVAHGGIGNVTALNTSLTSLAFSNSVTGDVHVSNAGNLTIGAVDGLATSSNASGQITFDVTGSLVFAVNTSATETVAATAVENATVNSQNIVVNSGVTVSSAGGDIELRAGDRITLQSSAVLQTNTTGTHNVTLASGFGDVDSDGQMILNGQILGGATTGRILLELNGTGGAVQGATGVMSSATLLLLSSGIAGAFDLDQSAANDVDLIAAETSGAISFRNSSVLSVSMIDGTPGITTTNDNVTLCATSITLNDAVQVGSGTIRLHATAGSVDQTSGFIAADALGVRAFNGINLSSANNDVNTFAADARAGSINIVDVDGFATGAVTADGCFTTSVSGITSNVDFEACVTTGNIQLTAAVNVLGTVRLEAAAGDVTQTVSGVVNAENLAIRAFGQIDLDQAVNNIRDVFAAVSTTSGSIAFKDAGGFTVGTIASGNCVAQIVGVNTTNGSIELTTDAGDINNLDGVYARGTGNVFLTATTSGNILLNGATSAAGSGNIVVSTEGGFIEVNEVVSSTSGNILMLAEGAANDIGVDAGIQSSSGHISLIAADTISLSATGEIQTGGGGTLYLDAESGSVSMDATSTLTTASGGILVHADRNVTIGDIASTQGDVSIIAIRGSILDADPNESDNDISSVGLRLQAGSSVGLSGGSTNALEIRVSTLSARASSGGISLLESDGVTVGDVAVTVQEVLSSGSTTSRTDATQSDLVTTANGSIVLRSQSGNIVLTDGTAGPSGMSVMAAGSGNVLLQTLAANGDLIVNSSVTSASGHLTLNAGDDVDLNANLSTGGDGTVLLAASNRTADAAGSIVDGISIEGTVSTIRGDILLTSGYDIQLARAIISDSGDIGLMAANDVVQFSTGDIKTGAGDLFIDAGRNWSMSATAEISAGGQDIIGQANGDIRLGIVSATNATVNRIALRAGGDIVDMNSSAVNIQETVATASTSLSLRAGGTIGDSASSNGAPSTNNHAIDLNIDSLSANAGGSIHLREIAAGKAITIANTAAVTVVIDGITRVNFNSTTSPISESRNVAALEDLTTRNGDIKLVAESGTITIEGGSDAVGLLAGNGGDVLLEARGTASDVVTEASVASGTGHITLNADDDVVISESINTAGSGTVVLLANNGTADAGGSRIDGININGTITLADGDLVAESAEDIRQTHAIQSDDGNVAMIAERHIEQTSGGDITLAGGDILVDAGENWTMAAGTVLQAGGGDFVGIATKGDLAVGRITATRTSLTAGGDIINANAASPNVSGMSLILRAGGSIGGSATTNGTPDLNLNAINTNVAVLAASSKEGIYIEESNDLTVDHIAEVRVQLTAQQANFNSTETGLSVVRAAAALEDLTTTGNGAIKVVTLDGTIIVNRGVSTDAGIIANGTGDVLIEARGAGHDIVLNADVMSASGHITIDGADSVVINNDITTSLNGSVYVVAHNSTITVNNGNADSIGIATQDGDILMEAAIDVTLNAMLTSSAGNVGLRAGTSVFQNSDITIGGDLLVVASQNIEMISNSRSVADGGELLYSAGQTISLGLVQATNVSLDAGADILDSRSNQATNIRATNLRMIAGGRIGDSDLLNGASTNNNAIDTEVLRIAARSATGIHVQEAAAGGSIVVTSVARISVDINTERANFNSTTTTVATSESLDGLADLTTTNNGDIKLQTLNGTITVQDGSGAVLGSSNGVGIHAHRNGDVLLASRGMSGDVVMNRDVVSDRGHITLFATDDVSLNADVSTGFTGTISITATNSSNADSVSGIEMQSDATIRTDGGNIRLAAGNEGDIRLALVDARTGDVSLVAERSILDNNAAAMNVRADALRIIADATVTSSSNQIGAIGGSATQNGNHEANLNAIDTEIAVLAAQSADGIYISEANGLTISNTADISIRQVEFNGTTTIITDNSLSDLTSTVAGSIKIQNVLGSIVLSDGDDADGVSVQAGGRGDVLIQTLHDAGDITVAAVLLSANGHVTLLSSDDIETTAAISTSGSGSVLIVATNGATDAAGSIIDGISINGHVRTQNGNVLIQSQRDVLQTAAIGSIAGSLGIIAARDIHQTSSGDLSTSSGDIVVEAARDWHMAQGTRIFAGGGEFIGAAVNGNLELGFVNATRVALTAGMDITDANGTVTNVSAETLSLRAGGRIGDNSRLNGSPDDNTNAIDTAVTTLAALSENGVYISEADALTIDTVDAISVTVDGILQSNFNSTSTAIIMTRFNATLEDIATRNNGPIKLVTLAGSLIVNTGGNVSSGISAGGSGDVLLEARSAGSNVEVYANVQSEAGHVTLDASNAVVIRHDIQTGNNGTIYVVSHHAGISISDENSNSIAVTTAHGDIYLNAATHVITTGELRSVFGNTAVEAGRDIQQNADFITGGDIVTIAQRGITMGSNSRSVADGGELLYSAGQTISLGLVQATNVSLDAGADILDSGSNQATNIRATNLRMIAGGRIGDSDLLNGASTNNNAIDTEVLRIAARSATGIHVQEAAAGGSVVVTSVARISVDINTERANFNSTTTTVATSESLDGLADLTTTNNGDIKLVARNGTITVEDGTGSEQSAEDRSGIVANGNGDILLQAFGAASDLIVLADVRSGSGDVSVVAADDVHLMADVTTGSPGSVFVLASNSQIDTTDGIIMQGGTVITSDGGNVRIVADNEADIRLGFINAGSGSVSLLAERSILDNNAVSLNVRAGVLRMVADAAISNASDQSGIIGGPDSANAPDSNVTAIDTQVTTLAASAASGLYVLERDGLTVQSTGDIAVRQQNFNSTSTLRVDNALSDLSTTRIGKISLQSLAGSLVLEDGDDSDGVAISANGTGNVLIQTMGETGDIIINSGVDSATGHVTLNSADDLDVGAAISTAGSGSIVLKAADRTTNSTTASETDGIAISAVVSTKAGDVLVQSQNDIHQSAMLKSQSGDIAVIASQDFVQLSGGDVNSRTGDVLIEAGRNWSMASGSAITAGGGELIGEAVTGELAISEMTATQIALTARGNIIDSNSDANNISANTLTLRAGGRIGSDSDAIETKLQTLAAHSATGIFLLEADDLIVDRVDAISVHVRDPIEVHFNSSESMTPIQKSVRALEDLTTTANGTIQLTTINGSIVLNSGRTSGPALNTTAISAHGTGNVLLTSNGASSDITANGAVQSTSGNIVLQASDDLNINDTITTSGVGTVQLLAGNRTVDDNRQEPGSQVDGINIDAMVTSQFGNIEVESAHDIRQEAKIAGGGGDIHLLAANNIFVLNDITSMDGVVDTTAKQGEAIRLESIDGNIRIGRSDSANSQILISTDEKAGSSANTGDSITLIADRDGSSGSSASSREGRVTFLGDVTLSTDGGVAKKFGPRPELGVTSTAFFEFVSNPLPLALDNSPAAWNSLNAYINAFFVTVGVAGEENLQVDLDWQDLSDETNVIRDGTIQQQSQTLGILNPLSSERIQQFLVATGGDKNMIGHLYTSLDYTLFQKVQNRTTIVVDLSVGHHSSINVEGTSISQTGATQSVPGRDIASSDNAFTSPGIFENGIAIFKIPTVTPAPPALFTSTFVPRVDRPVIAVPLENLAGFSASVTAGFGGGAVASSVFSTEVYFQIRRQFEIDGPSEVVVERIVDSSLISSREAFEEFVRQNSDLQDGAGYEIWLISETGGQKVERPIVEFEITGGQPGTATEIVPEKSEVPHLQDLPFEQPDEEGTSDEETAPGASEPLSKLQLEQDDEADVVMFRSVSDSDAADLQSLQQQDPQPAGMHQPTGNVWEIKFDSEQILEGLESHDAASSTSTELADQLTTASGAILGLAVTRFRRHQRESEAEPRKYSRGARFTRRNT